MTPARYLIVRLGSLGDILHALPAVLALRAEDAEAEIDWVVEPAGARLLEYVPEVSRVVVADTKLWRRQWFRAETMRCIFRTARAMQRANYDVAIDFQGLLKSSLIPYCGGARRRLGFTAPHLREPASRFFYTELVSPRFGHVVDMNLELVRPLLRKPPAIRFPGRFWKDQEYDRVRQWVRSAGLERFVLISPGAGWSTKLWPVAHHRELALRLEREGLPAVFTWGPGDQTLAQSIGGLIGPAAWRGLSTTVGELAALIEQASVFFGGDTGPTHLAAALGKPVVAVFGPSMETRNGPYCRLSRVFRIDLPCSNCYFRTCPYPLQGGAPMCMQTPPERVFEAIKELWQADRLTG